MFSGEISIAMIQAIVGMNKGEESSVEMPSTAILFPGEKSIA